MQTISSTHVQCMNMPMYEHVHAMYEHVYAHAAALEGSFRLKMDEEQQRSSLLQSSYCTSTHWNTGT
jgi:hypothetical protein